MLRQRHMFHPSISVESDLVTVRAAPPNLTERHNYAEKASIYSRGQVCPCYRRTCDVKQQFRVASDLAPRHRLRRAATPSLSESASRAWAAQSSHR